MFAFAVGINTMLTGFHLYTNLSLVHIRSEFKIHPFCVPEDVNIHEIVISLSAHWLCLEGSDSVVHMSCEFR